MTKINYKTLLLKKNIEPITCLTAYSKPLANILDGRVSQRIREAMEGDYFLGTIVSSEGKI